MDAIAFYRSDQGKIYLSVAGVSSLDNKSWDKFEGGDLTPDSPGPYNPGNMKPSLAVGGLRKRSNATIQRAWSESLMGAYFDLDLAAGQAAFTCSYTPVKADGVTATGLTIVYTGILLTVTRPNYDSTSSAVVLLQCELECDEAITTSSS